MNAFTPEFQTFVDLWRNDAEYNQDFHTRCTMMVDASKLLKAHRDFIEANQYGFGDRAFHCIWLALVQQMPEAFTFLEVGVFKGQVLSLVALIAKVMEKRATVYGATTLTNTEDVRCRYPAGDYPGWIFQIHKHFEVPQPTLIVGKSNDPKVIEQCGGEHDIVYIDGGHDLKDVVDDIKHYAPKTKVGGFLVMDDASINRINVGSCWPGLEDVAQAVKDHLDNDARFKLLFVCGHLNVFQRVKE